MKPSYDPYIKRWSVKGLGYYDNLASAKEAIRNHTLSDSLLIRINPKTKQLLQELADNKEMSVSDLVRQIIEREVNENE